MFVSKSCLFSLHLFSVAVDIKHIKQFKLCFFATAAQHTIRAILLYHSYCAADRYLLCMLWQIHLLQYFIHSLLSFVIAQVAIVPDLAKAWRQYMLLKSSYKFFSPQSHRLLFTVISVIFIFKCDIVIAVNTLYAMIADGNLV